LLARPPTRPWFAPTRFYFGLDLDASQQEIETIADYYPVFRVEYRLTRE
jgi:hypothetical protein